MKPGTFQKGQSGNPSGRPKIVAEVRDLARKYTEEAIKTLSSIATDVEAPPAARVAAASTLLDRGWGKAQQHVTVAKSPLDDVDPATLAALEQLLSDGQESVVGSGEGETRH